MTTFRLSRLARTALAVALLAAGGCGDYGTSPGIYGGPTTASVAYCALTRPTWVAFQDGDGPWTRADAEVAGDRITFRHTFITDRGAIATARTSGSAGTSLFVQYGLPAELAIATDTQPAHCDPVASSPLVGTVAGLGPDDFAVLSVGFGVRDIVAPFIAGYPNFSLGGLIAGPQDLLATRVTQPGRVNPALTRIIRRRTPEPVDGVTLPVLDFESAEAFVPFIAHVTVEGIGPEGASSITRLRTARGGNEISSLVLAQTATTRDVYALPESRLQPEDLQLVQITANPLQPQRFRFATTYFRSPTNVTVTLGPLIAAPTLGIATTGGALRPRAHFDDEPAYDRQTSISYQQSGTTFVSVGMTGAYAALNPGRYELDVPDLSAAAGFDAGWALRPGVPLFWTATRTGGTLGPRIDGEAIAGDTRRVGVAFDTFTP